MSAARAGGTRAPGHAFHPTVLREYDIRGIIGQTLGVADARALGRAYATLLDGAGSRRVCLGFDGRLSSPELAEALGEGLCAGGIEVLRIGRGPTPMLYFAVHHLNADGGIQVTGSHNPPDHNGFKMMLGKKSLFGARIQELGRIAAGGAFATGAGRSVDSPVFEAYVERLLSDFRGRRELSVVWDAGNGATGEALAALAARLPGLHTLLYAEIDGRFPNHHPDPTVPENLVDLIRTVQAEGAEVGIAFDGDGDRIGVVDGQGRIMFGDQMMQILAADVLARHPGAPIIADVKASQALFDEIGRLGGKPVMYKTGHSLMKAAMAEMKAPLAGEMSGHIFYSDGFYGHDDALYVAVRLLTILAQSERTLAAWHDRMAPMVNTPELRFDCPDETKFGVIERVKAQLEAEGAEMTAIDGVRVKTADGWWLLRASNTQAVLVARAEAADEAGLARLKQQIADNLEAAGVTPP
ncbi:MAG TPA: phosphomannomutase/phosphoglucomutase, partial [Geminicoccaceae bacterium]|nr:phosphomannomutase/phosphoglucomutase [Geminicoccaceae bacterium]